MNNELTDYFDGDELAASVWSGKYAAEGETLPTQMFERMAKEFARIDEKYQKKEKNFFGKRKTKGLSEYGATRKDLTYQDIYNMFDGFKYVIPQGSILATLGTDTIASLSNCVVTSSPEDSYSSINKTDGELIQYFVRRCGCGTDISNLRPAGAKTNNTARSSTGAVSFMERFSNTCREVAMNGRKLNSASLYGNV